MVDRQWKLGEDLSTCDSLLDGLTFDDLILAVHCNCRVITKAAVYADMVELLERNIDIIMAEARKGREA